jgi:uncharacterized protein YndB with AHSA1/START domain
MNARSTDIASTAEREISATRVFDAPRDLVFAMCTDPEHIVKWWGPNGFSTTIQEMDVRPGGVWRHVMHGPDGVDYPNKSVYDEVVRPERLVYSHSGSRPGGPAAQFQSTVIFEDLGGKTRLTVRMVFRTAAECNQVAKEYGAVEGLSQTLDRLREQIVARR